MNGPDEFAGAIVVPDPQNAGNGKKENPSSLMKAQKFKVYHRVTENTALSH
jgi:hypothetical protein